jgi:hypothetical protein
MQGDKMNERSEITIQEQTGKLDSIDQAILEPLVQRALGRPTIKVIEWDVQQLHGGYGGGVFASTVYRFTGQGCDKDQTVSWSLILKTFSPVDTTDPSSAYFQHREAQAYRSGWLDDLPGGLVAPDCFGVVEFPAGGAWVWLEEVVDDYGGSWPLERFGLAARHLGQFNGAYLLEQPFPRHPWFSVHWLRKAVAEIDPVITLFSEMQEHPMVRRFYPAEVSTRFLNVLAERERLLDALDRLPRTICHLDAFTRNLFSRRRNEDDQTVAIDWAFVGYGAVGEELEPLVCRSIFLNEVELIQAQELDEIVFAGYLDGLSDAGWQGDGDQVRLGFTAAVTLRYLVGNGQALPLILDGSIRDWLPQALGLPFDEAVEHNVAYYRFVFDLADEALELLIKIP